MEAWHDIQSQIDAEDNINQSGRKLQRLANNIREADIQELEKLINDSHLFNITLWAEDSIFDREKNDGSRIKAEIVNNSLFFYYNGSKTGKKIYITSVRCNFYESITQLIEKIRNIYTTEIGFSIYFHAAYARDENGITNVVDFKGLTCLGLELENVILKNVIVDYEWFKDPAYKEIRDTLIAKLLKTNKKDIATKEVPIDVNTHISRCILQEGIEIISTYYCSIIECYNITDYSFIKKSTEQITINMMGRSQYPKTMNLTGLPSGNYRLSISFSKPQYETDKSIVFNENDMWTFEGMPSTIKQLIVTVNVKPSIIFPHFSFKGIPQQILNTLTPKKLYGDNADKSRIKVYVNAGRMNPGVIRLGYKTIPISQAYWSPNKLDLERAIKANDLFLDFWRKGHEPNREYIPPEQSDEYKELVNKADYKEYDKEKRAEEEAANIKFLVNKLKRTLKVGEKYYRKNDIKEKEYDEYILIKDMTDNEITWETYYKRDWYNDSWVKGSGAKYTYEKFLELKGNTDYIINNKTFKQLFGDYGHKRLLKIRKERKKEDRQREKLMNEPDVQETPKPVNEPKPAKIRKKKFNFDEQIESGTPVQKREDIEVVDYKERSYALFGNTYDIKDQLKDMGAYYNKFLTHNGRKQPGWIVSKKKKAELEKIIGQFD